MRKINRRRKFIIGGVIVALLLISGTAFWFTKRVQSNINQLSDEADYNSLAEPEIRTNDVISGLDHPWDIVFPTRDIMIYSQRSGEIRANMLPTSEDWLVKIPDNLYASGEGGLMGLALDSSFMDNRYLYACYNARVGNSGVEVKVERFQLSSDYKTVFANATIVSGIENRNGRHSGCRMAMDKLGNLWIGTGDGAIATAPQDPLSLAGKVLRVTRDGKAVEGNLKAPFDTRIFSYGHRNIQGIIILDKPLANGAYGYTQEQGTDKDDELNYLVSGNFGYDPNDKGVYKETAPMTDLVKFPLSVRSVWSTGEATLATSGLEQLTFRRWQAWRGRLLVANLKAGSLSLVELNEKGEYLSNKKLFEGKYGRIRTAVEGLDGNVYIATDNGNNQDKIVRLQVICTVCD